MILLVYPSLSSVYIVNPWILSSDRIGQDAQHVADSLDSWYLTVKVGNPTLFADHQT